MQRIQRLLGRGATPSISAIPLAVGGLAILLLMGADLQVGGPDHRAALERSTDLQMRYLTCAVRPDISPRCEEFEAERAQYLRLESLQNDLMSFGADTESLLEQHLGLIDEAPALFGWNPVIVVASDTPYTRAVDEAWAQQLQQHPNDPVRHAASSMWFLLTERPKEAEQELQKAHELDPFFPRWKSLLSSILAKKGDQAGVARLSAPEISAGTIQGRPDRAATDSWHALRFSLEASLKSDDWPSVRATADAMMASEEDYRRLRGAYGNAFMQARHAR